MGMMILALLGAVGSLFGGWFTGKGVAAGGLAQGAGDAVKSIAYADAATSFASTLPIIAEASSKSWLARNWRPMTMMVFLLMILSRWFGYMPPNMSVEEFGHVWNLLTAGICGYGAQRTIEKVVDKVNVGRAVSAYLGKGMGKDEPQESGTSDEEGD